MTLLRSVAGLMSLLLTTGLATAGSDALAERPTTISLPDAAVTMPALPTGEVLVKFADSAKARALADGSVHSLSNTPLDEVEAIVEQFGLEFELAFRNKNLAQLRNIEQRAERYSGEAQPDLGGWMFARPERPDEVLAAAKALNGTPGVEFAVVYGLPEPPNWLGGMDADCGVTDPDTGDCFDDENGTPFCTDLACCELICDFDPFCCAEDAAMAGFWDELCVDVANLYCGMGDRCASGLNGSCLEVHLTPGCVNEDCCNDVCTQDDFCCMAIWDENCVSIAEEFCAIDLGDGPTPDFTVLQGYLTGGSYFDDPGGAPAELAPPAPNLVGFGGEGYDLAEMTAFAQELLDEYGIDATGNGVITDGAGSKVAVIEWAYFEDHEDLDVVTEPGQTLIMTEWVTEPDHATACLGIINAKDNDKGVRGIVPAADAYFFPLTSVEEGPRQLNAWISALEVLGEGDFISASYGPPGSLANSAPLNALINVASDLGITVCFSAGNDCQNLDDFNDVTGLPDTGGVCVGAGSPGRPHYRLPFSNHCQDCVDSGTVHIQSWGSNVTTCGRGDLYYPGLDDNRAYTVRFNGTSSAAPLICGMMCAVQGLAKQIYGFPFPPTLLREAVSRGFPQGGLNPRFTGGFDPFIGCSIDSDPDEGPNIIGPFSRLASDFGSVSAWMLNQDGFNNSPFLRDYFLTVGNAITDDSVFRISQAGDQVEFKAESVRVDPGSLGGNNDLGEPEISDIGNEGRLLAAADVTQVLLWFETLEPQLLEVTYTSNQAVTGTEFAIGILEAWHSGLRRYIFQAAAFGGAAFTFTIANPDIYFFDINNDGKRDFFVKDTLYSFSTGGSGSGGVGGGGSIAGHTRIMDYATIQVTATAP